MRVGSITASKVKSSLQSFCSLITNHWGHCGAGTRGIAGGQQSLQVYGPSSWIRPTWPHNSQLRWRRTSAGIVEAVAGSTCLPSYSTGSSASSRQYRPFHRWTGDTRGPATSGPPNQQRIVLLQCCRSTSPGECSSRWTAASHRHRGTDRESTVCTLAVESSPRQLNRNDLYKSLKRLLLYLQWRHFDTPSSSASSALTSMTRDCDWRFASFQVKHSTVLIMYFLTRTCVILICWRLLNYLNTSHKSGYRAFTNRSELKFFRIFIGRQMKAKSIIEYTWSCNDRHFSSRRWMEVLLFVAKTHHRMQQIAYQNWKMFRYHKPGRPTRPLGDQQ